MSVISAGTRVAISSRTQEADVCPPHIWEITDSHIERVTMGTRHPYQQAVLIQTGHCRICGVEGRWDNRQKGAGALAVVGQTVSEGRPLCGRRAMRVRDGR